MKIILIIFCSAISFINMMSQVYEKPNFSSASHPMTVTKIEITNNQTIISLSIENQSETGYFCADKKIRLIDVTTNKRYDLIKSKNIPVCPDTYSFNAVGEVLEFQLIFPKINPSPKYLTIIENCESNCFSIKGIILNADFNKEIDSAYEKYAKGDQEISLSIFKETIKNHPDYSFGILYFNIIQLLVEKNDMENARIWYKKFLSAKAIDNSEILNKLKSQNYYPQIKN